MSFDEDYAYGKEQEILAFPILRRHFGKSLQHNQDEFASFDFEDANQVLEMKSRKSLSTEYTDIMIKTLKIENCENSKKECYLIFKFFDKLTFIKYDRTLFRNYKSRYMLIKSRPGKPESLESRTFIPFNDLTLIKTYEVVCLID